MNGIEVGEGLLGTCRGLRSVATEEQIDDPVFCEELDSVAFRCEQCDWWVDPEDCDDGVCSECRSDQENT